MKVLNQKPPNYNEVIKVFPEVGNMTTVVFTYGDTLYAPGMEDDWQPSPDLEAHELTHVRQQGESPENWWRRYLIDVDFRIVQELEAYGNQYRVIKEIYNVASHKDRLFKIASDLSGPMYGNALTFQEAENKIRRAAI